jgi:hypothetical protein
MAREETMMRNWQTTLIGLAALMLLAAWPLEARAAAPCGDLNQNGSVNSGDALLLLQVASGANPGTSLCGGAGALQCGDMNKDGAISTGDVVILLNHTVGNPTLFFCSGTGNDVAAGTTVSGNISQNQRWVAGTPNCCACDASNTIFVEGTTFVNPGVTITIKPGVCVKEKKNAATPSVLVFKPGAQINAAGTATCPIVFTSDQAPGSRGIGDHGGLVLNGNGPVNCPGNTCQAEGLSNVPFGGTNANDSSGLLRFARVEFSGIELSPDNELNILTQNGLGRSTTIDHVQGNVGFDDCLEWFGGTVNEKFIVGSGCGDDIFDWQLATTGSFQYGLGVQLQATLQAGNGNNGFEGDNNENGFDFLPRSNPKYCNFTMIGTKGQPGATGGSGALLRRGTAGKILNTLMMNFNSGGIALRDDATAAQACVNHTTLKTTEPYLVVKNSILRNNGAAGDTQITSALTSPACTANEWYDMLVTQDAVQPTRGAGNVGPDPLIDPTYPTDPSSGQFVPPASGPLTGSGTDCKAFDPFFDTTNYIGAFAPGGANWLFPAPGSCWINFAQN